MMDNPALFTRFVQGRRWKIHSLPFFLNHLREAYVMRRYFHSFVNHLILMHDKYSLRYFVDFSSFDSLPTNFN